MESYEYLVTHLICVVRANGNNDLINRIKQRVASLSDKEQMEYFRATSGQLNRKHINIGEMLSNLYNYVFAQDGNIYRDLSPSQKARLWQGKFRYGVLSTGYTETDYYHDIVLNNGTKLFAVVPKGFTINQNYYMKEEDYNVIRKLKLSEVYRILQMDPYWGDDKFGPKTQINEYVVQEKIRVAYGYILENQHLGQWKEYDHMLSDDEKKCEGITNIYVEESPRGEEDYSYRYIIPPIKQIFVPDEDKANIALLKANIFTFKNDMEPFDKKRYENSIKKAQDKKIDYLSMIYDTNVMLNKK